MKAFKGLMLIVFMLIVGELLIRGGISLQEWLVSLENWQGKYAMFARTFMYLAVVVALLLAYSDHRRARKRVDKMAEEVAKGAQRFYANKAE